MARMVREKLKGIIVWEPMMKSDNLDSALNEAGSFDGLDVIHYWDDKKELGNMFARMLHLNSPAWDVYLFFSKGIKWDGSAVPEPSFWMHQLPEKLGADRSLTLNTIQLAEKLCGLLDCGNNQAYDDLGFYLHMSALSGLAGRSSCHTMEDLRDALRNQEVHDEEI